MANAPPAAACAYSLKKRPLRNSEPSDAREDKAVEAIAKDREARRRRDRLAY